MKSKNDQLEKLGILAAQSETADAQSTFTPAVDFYRGPLSNRPEPGDANRIWIAEETGAIYYDDGNSWSLVDREYNSVSTERLFGSFDHLIDDVSDIENLDSLVSVGDTVRVKQPDTPYVLTSQPTLDTSHIRLEFESRFARDGNPILKIANETNIQGLIVGQTSPTEDITILNYGYDGNKDNQTHTGQNKDALQFYDVTDFEVRSFYATHTYPFHEHNTGGSGISVNSDSASNFHFENCRVYQIGDRAMQISGTHGTFRNIRNDDGWDRTIAFRNNAAHHVVDGIRATNCDDTSMIGFANDPAQPTTDVLVTNASWYNLPRGLANITGAKDVTFDGVRGYNDESTTPAGIPYMYIVRFNKQAENVTVSNMDVFSTGDIERAIQCDAPVTGGTIDNVTLSNVNVQIDSAYRPVNILAPGYRFNNVTVEVTNLGGAGAVVHAEAATTMHGLDVTSTVLDIEIAPGATGTVIQNADYETIDDQGTNTVINGEAVESAAAETPQGDYPVGTFVDFTDSTDGTGNGYYRQKRDGTFVKLA
ncbi:hypothetical protein [Haladaptatus halobius]|uniref:hypothetical protein n=1 Tax=Haladaptatus halobius TaxID=2884875 RepID=UPI001D0A2FC0|nr:hypothetical protein [Haladaptatus halobius]